MDESNVVDLLPLIAERVLRRAAEMSLHADRIEREFGGDPDFEGAEGLVRELRVCAENIERVGTLEGAPAEGWPGAGGLPQPSYNRAIASSRCDSQAAGGILRFLCN